MRGEINTNEVDTVLADVQFPATADELAGAAEERGASIEVITFFESLSPDTTFENRSEVLSATQQVSADDTGTTTGTSDSLTDDFEDTL